MMKGFIRVRGMAPRVIAALALSCAVCTLEGAAQSSAADSLAYAKPTRDAYLKLASEAEAMLRRDVLGVWFSRTVDAEKGGFYSNFTRDWRRSPSEGKFSVFQGRMTWVAAEVAVRRPELAAEFLPVARHGL